MDMRNDVLGLLNDNCFYNENARFSLFVFPESNYAERYPNIRISINRVFKNALQARRPVLITSLKFSGNCPIT